MSASSPGTIPLQVLPPGLDPNVPFLFDIDVVGSCNLRCPSCPVGNSPEVDNPNGWMRPEMLDRILKKAKSEVNLQFVSLYNWTEPLLHPNLAEMVRIVRGHGVECGLSSNLNIIKNIDQVMQAQPSHFKISISGFTQDTYGKTHRKGDIEVVKQHMRKLAEAHQKAGGKTLVYVAFHRYLGNHPDEHKMRQFAESLGFGFKPIWAYLMPLEKMLAFVGDPSAPAPLSEEDRRIVQKLALPPAEAIAAASKHKEDVCGLQTRQMSLTFRGDVTLCCTVYDQNRYTIGNYLEHSFQELQRRKLAHSQCGSCASHGLHVYFTFGAKEFDDIALRNIHKHYPGATLTGTRPRGIAKLFYKVRRKWQKVFSGSAKPRWT